MLETTQHSTILACAATGASDKDPHRRLNYSSHGVSTRERRERSFPYGL